jgi:hypothetical protein
MAPTKQTSDVYRAPQSSCSLTINANKFMPARSPASGSKESILIGVALCAVTEGALITPDILRMGSKGLCKKCLTRLCPCYSSKKSGKHFGDDLANGKHLMQKCCFQEPQTTCNADDIMVSACV